MFEGLSIFALASVRRALDRRTLTEVDRAAVDAIEGWGSSSPEAMKEIRDTAGCGKLQDTRSLSGVFRSRWNLVRWIMFGCRRLFSGTSIRRFPKRSICPRVLRRTTCGSLDAARSLKLKGITVYRYGSRSHQALLFVEDERVPDCRECAV